MRTIFNGMTAKFEAIASKASEIKMLLLGTPTYKTVQHWFNTIQSSGRISGMTLTAHSPADGTLDISAGTGIIKITNTVSSDTKFFDYAGGIVSLTDNALNYIYAYYDSGTGTVKVAATTDRSTIHDYDQFTIGRCFRSGTDATDISVSGTNIYNGYRRIHNRLVKKYGFDWASGAILSETDTRKLSVTAGVWYIGNTEIDTAALNTNVSGSFETYYYNPTTALWVETSGVTQLGNTQYNNISTGTGLETLIANKYANYWVYMCPMGELYVVYGQAYYNTLAEAQNTQSPTLLPTYLSSNARLIARITFLKNATNFSAVSNALLKSIPSGVATNHNQLAGLQGGTIDQYYHVTSAQNTIIADTSFGKKGFEVKIISDTTDLTTGDGKVSIFISPEFNGYNLVDVDACVSTPSSSGLPTIQIRNVTDSVDMLSTRITIDENEKTSYTALTQPVIDTTKDDVATGDELAIDVDVAGTGAKGLTIILTFQLP